MAGIKGRSGRRPTSCTEKRLAYIDKCWEVTMEFIQSDAPLIDRAEMASKIAIKSIPDYKPEQDAELLNADLVFKDIPSGTKSEHRFDKYLTADK